MFKSGFVSIIGRPNVGKSTLLNQILKQKLTIVTSKPQTTRNKIQGIYTADDCQIIFIDTPGIHKAQHELGNVMNKFAIGSLEAIDLVLFVVDASSKKGAGDDYILEELKKSKVPTILVLNKVDLVQDEEKLKENIESYKEAFNFTGGLTISASNGHNIDLLIDKVKNLLDEGPMYYPEDQLLDQPIRFVVAEMIREKVLLKTKEEVPHSVAIMIEKFVEPKKENGIVEIYAAIIVDRESQKKIIIGKKGSMIKDIGTLARKDIVNLLGNKVYLELFVKVVPNWRDNKMMLRSLGYDPKNT